MNSKVILVMGVSALVIVIVGIMLNKKSNMYKQASVPTVNQGTTPQGTNTGSGEDNINPSVKPNSTALVLDIIEPVSGSTVTNPSISVKGKTVPDADVFVNDIELKADKSGNFNVPLTLEEGENEIIIGANNDEGAWVDKTILITYESNQ